MSISTSKYKNKKVAVNIDSVKVTFDSQAEHARYCHLALLQKAKLISNLELQPKFELEASFKRNGKAHQAINYIADFIYTSDSITVVEDVKGKKTDLYQLKKKLFLSKYGDGIKFLEVTAIRNRFIEVEI